MKITDIHCTVATLPPRVLIHGLEGVGKTTLAARFLRPVFLQTEDGTGALALESFGLLEELEAVRASVAALGNEPHDFRTLVLDCIDALEPLIWQAVCRERGWSSIEAPGYGRGYVETDAVWRDLLAAFDWLRRTRGMTIVLIAHSAVETVNDPRVPSYTSYQLRVHKRARGLLQDWADVIGFLAPDIAVKSDDVGFGRKRARADGGSLRHLHFEARPAFVAKNRFALPAKMPVPLDFDFASKLAPLLPSPAPAAPVPIRAV
jgi:hypothetical protein